MTAAANRAIARGNHTGALAPVPSPLRAAAAGLGAVARRFAPAAMAVVTAALLLAPCAEASDHADPAWLPADQKEANITDLFFYPDGDRWVVILNVRPSLTAPPPYVGLKRFEYEIAIDTHSRVEFCKHPRAAAGKTPTPADCEELSKLPWEEGGYDGPAEKQLYEGNLARYGGTIPEPGQISPDVRFRLHFSDDLAGVAFSAEGGSIRPTPVTVFDDGLLPDLAANPQRYADRIWVYVGVRDDPFIFPRFFNTNVIAMVISVPKAAFTTTSTDWLLWGVSRFVGGEQIDHVGRSNRTQLGRFDLLNTLPPNRHVEELRDVTESRKAVQDFFRQVLPPLANLNQLSGFLLRGYDYAPDVMIHSTRRPEGFPNGRRLEDDVADTTCRNGDCPLYENSYADSARFPRATTNDKKFLDRFPYLAEPWPFRPQPFTGSPWIWFRDHLLWPLIGVAAAIVAVLWLRRRWCRRLRAGPVAPDV